MESASIVYEKNAGWGMTLSTLIIGFVVLVLVLL